MHCNNKRNNDYFEQEKRLQYHMRNVDKKEDSHYMQGIEGHYRTFLRLSFHAVLK